MEITYQIEQNIKPEEFVDLLVRSTLGERRPIADTSRIEKMCQHADIMITARAKGKLVGIARSLSDFSFCTYLSDLAVDIDYQHMGIGKKLIVETKKRSPEAKLILLAAPAAIDYYPKIGMQQYSYCFFINDEMEIK